MDLQETRPKLKVSYKTIHLLFQLTDAYFPEILIFYHKKYIMLLRLGLNKVALVLQFLLIRFIVQKNTTITLLK